MEKVTIFEMGPRDGLQNEAAMISTADKIALVDMLTAAGFQKIEVTSFVSPKWVPQMADAHDVLTGIKRDAKVRYAALTPNMRGFDGAMVAHADEVAIFGSASEGFSQANINCSIDESFERFAPIMVAAKSQGIPVRGYVSCVTDCPYDGPTDPAKVAYVAGRLTHMGCYEIRWVTPLVRERPRRLTQCYALLNEVPPTHLAGHYHDTQARALDNIQVSLVMACASLMRCGWSGRLPLCARCQEMLRPKR